LNRYFSAKLLSLVPTREGDSIFSEMFSTSPIISSFGNQQNIQ